MNKGLELTLYTRF